MTPQYDLAAMHFIINKLSNNKKVLLISIKIIGIQKLCVLLIILTPYVFYVKLKMNMRFESKIDPYTFKNKVSAI